MHLAVFGRFHATWTYLGVSRDRARRIAALLLLPGPRKVFGHEIVWHRSERSLRWFPRHGGCTSSTDDTDPREQLGRRRHQGRVLQGVLPHNCQVCDDGTTACAPLRGEEQEVRDRDLRAGGAHHVTSQCTGALPKLCKVCDDGSSKCAHWGVKDGKCEIETCPPPPPPVTSPSQCKGALPAFLQGLRRRLVEVRSLGRQGRQVRDRDPARVIDEG